MKWETPDNRLEDPAQRYFQDLEDRIEILERTVAGLQVLLGKASEYKARPKRGRLPR